MLNSVSNVAGSLQHTHYLDDKELTGSALLVVDHCNLRQIAHATEILHLCTLVYCHDIVISCSTKSQAYKECQDWGRVNLVFVLYLKHSITWMLSKQLLQSNFNDVRWQFCTCTHTSTKEKLKIQLQQSDSWNPLWTVLLMCSFKQSNQNL